MSPIGRRSRTIPSLKQLPDSRRAIVIALKREGTATISQLAATLGLTGEAVRQQLLQLHREGWVETKLERSGARETRTGRPATIYRLTEAGDHLFPKAYDALSIEMMDAIASELGTDTLHRVLARVTNDRITAAEPLVRDLPLAERVDAMKSWYLPDDLYMEVERVNGDYRLIERNCPYLNTALARPSLCSVSVSALSRLFGVRVHREESFQNGDGRCVFRVNAAEPIDVAAWQFQLE